MAADAIVDKKGRDVELLQVTDLLVITDVFIIASGSSRTHVQSLAEHVEEVLREREGVRPLRREGVSEAEWVLLDYGDIVIHLFQPEQRDYYGLERLWRDAPPVPWEERAATDAW